MKQSIARFSAPTNKETGKSQAYFYDIADGRMTLGNTALFAGPFSLAVLVLLVVGSGVLYFSDKASPIILIVNLPLFLVVYHAVMIPVVLLMFREMNLRIRKAAESGEQIEQTSGLLNDIISKYTNRTVVRIMAYFIIGQLIPWGYVNYTETNRLFYLVIGSGAEIVLPYLFAYICSFQNLSAVKLFKDKLGIY